MLNKVYSFLDWDGWSGERVVLRPDGTIPVARLYIENSSKQDIARYFYVTTVFAFEESGKENREQWQCGVELLGDTNSTSDTEIIMLAVDILRTLDIGDIKIQLSHAGMLKALLKDMQLSPEKEARLLTHIRDGDWEVLTKTKTVDSKVNRLITLLYDLRGKSSGFLENLKALPETSPELKAELDNFSEITRILDILKVKYRIDITSTTGFEYYTGLCFKFLVEDKKIGGGGRYNDLVPLVGGKKTPACGLALYMDPLMSLLRSKPDKNIVSNVVVKGTTSIPETIKSCFELSQTLRNAGYATKLDFSNYKSDWRWIVSAQQEPSPFIVIDQSGDLETRADSIEEVIQIIRSSE
jgi:histidyl-tRNA synthetase